MKITIQHYTDETEAVSKIVDHIPPDIELIFDQLGVRNEGGGTEQ